MKAVVVLLHIEEELLTVLHLLADVLDDDLDQDDLTSDHTLEPEARK